MARRTTALARRSSNVIVLSPPRRVSRGRARGISRRGRGRRRSRGGSGIGASATIPIALGGGMVGWLGAKGYLAKLPQIGGSRMVTLGIAGWAAMRFVKNKWVKAAGLAAIAAAAFDFGRVQGGGSPLLGEEMLGNGGDPLLGQDDY